MEFIKLVPSALRGMRFSAEYSDRGTPEYGDSKDRDNPLWEYFQNHSEGNGIYKWEHYFEIYHRHLARFVGKRVNILEIGVYSGGSLEMWSAYFGPNCHIYGVDIEPACKKYERDNISVFVGDQADRAFWHSFKKQVNAVDVVIDDGGHSPEQQRITLEELLPLLSPGGVYICEDIHARFNEFTAFALALVDHLNEADRVAGPNIECAATNFQSAIHSIHFYPFVLVIEKNFRPLSKLVSSKRGTRWEPFSLKSPAI